MKWSIFVGSLIYSAVGIVIFLIGFKIFDWLVPCDFNKELENKNIAIAIVIAGFFIGLSIIIAATIG